MNRFYRTVSNHNWTVLRATVVELRSLSNNLWIPFNTAIYMCMYILTHIIRVRQTISLTDVALHLRDTNRCENNWHLQACGTAEPRPKPDTLRQLPPSILRYTKTPDLMCFNTIKITDLLFPVSQFSIPGLTCSRRHDLI